MTRPDADPAVTRRRRRRYLAAGAVVVLAGAGTGTYFGVRSGGSTASGAPRVTTKVETVTVSTGQMKESISTSGTIEPASEADLDFAVSGRVTGVRVATGQKVKKGQVLATVGSAALADDVAAARASLTSAQAALSTDEAAGDPTSTIDQAESQVSSATTALATAKANLADADLRSTIAGTVAAVNLVAGQQVSTGGGAAAGGSGLAGNTGSSATGTGTASSQIVVVATGSFEVSASVEDTQVSEIKVGEQAVITPSSSTTPVYGTVSSVSLLGSNSSGVATFPVTIAVTGSQSGLYAGSSADISIVVKDLQDVVEVPTGALSYSGGAATVTRVEGDRHVTTGVTTGATLDGETQITKGLSAGDKVLDTVVSFTAPAGGGTHTIFGTGGGSGGTRTFPAGGFGGGGFGGGGFTRGGTSTSGFGGST